MSLTIEEIYSIKCIIGSSLFMGRHDWENRIDMNVETCGRKNDAYIRFRTNSTIVSIKNDDTIYIVCVGGRKAVKFQHQTIGDTLNLIQHELSAHFSGSID